MQLNSDQAAVFKTALLAIRDDFALPDQLETGWIYRMSKYRYYSRGYEDLRFFIEQDEEGYLFLDYCLITDDSTSHYRIDHTGAVIPLENLQGQWGRPVLEDEEATQREWERIKAHNQNVYAVLQQKGLDGKDEHGQALFEMSTILIGTEWFIENKKR